MRIQFHETPLFRAAKAPGKLIFNPKIDDLVVLKPISKTQAPAEIERAKTKWGLNQSDRVRVHSEANSRNEIKVTLPNGSISTWIPLLNLQKSDSFSQHGTVRRERGNPAVVKALLQVLDGKTQIEVKDSLHVSSEE